MKGLLLFLAMIALFSCTDEDGARRALEGAGYTDIELTGYAGAACGQGDGTCTGFNAYGPTGKPVSGAVGCGYACKGCTIRLE